MDKHQSIKQQLKLIVAIFLFYFYFLLPIYRSSLYLIQRPVLLVVMTHIMEMKTELGLNTKGVEMVRENHDLLKFHYIVGAPKEVEASPTLICSVRLNLFKT